MTDDRAPGDEIDPALRTLDGDPLHGAAAVRDYFGDVYPRVLAFTEMLADQGVLRGLIGPRELTRVWERHILNSAAVVPFLGPGVTADVGSGAGLPGMVIAAMEPERSVVLIEPMERRVQWLLESARECGIENVTVLRGRAEEVRESVEADVITARAVASIDKLVKWCAPLLSEHGSMALLKGRSAADELERAKYALRKHHLAGEVLSAPTLEGLEPTTVVRLSR
ncbi:16S rRNA (guanine(527)-N(7))-methyltransferase RsmG [Demequina sp. NBRC 110052]|uniref:16S rRNA (guanine(527)-N(7))-methyltransferase RsmG n=1 Tax=Demequina sp. NBRC 110052 TaxID=1570341 RepID=UPI000A07B4E6|nr:16S rRNA (guanine(527)-N(7))-methyltransferase RsmG [Demequina sp. NBRC 110052]